MTRRHRSLLTAALAALVLAGCGSDSETSTAGESAATPEPTPTATATPAAPTGDEQDTSKKPTIAKPTGTPPTKLVQRDLVKGKGRAAKDGDMVTVQYVGVSFSTGEQFDASWDRDKEPFPFTLGAGQVIPGWDQGVAGMKVGGRRQLTIPPDLAYGPNGQGAIGPNETLIFTIDVTDIQPAA